MPGLLQLFSWYSIVEVIEMKIKIMIDGLLFVELTDEQVREVEANAGEAIMKWNGKAWKVQGTAKELYTLLYRLSLDYDIELS